MEMQPTSPERAHFLRGDFAAATRADFVWSVHSPADTRVHVGDFAASSEDLHAVLADARGALPEWSNQPIAHRVALLEKYRDRLQHHREAIARSIAIEVGKPLWEARQEATALAAKIGITVAEGLGWVADQTLEDIHGRIIHRPLGVVAIVSPFNLPAHLANGLLVPALLMGNTVVLKPSEKAPLSAAWLARCLMEAGLPAGVFSLVQGGSEVAEALTRSPELNGLFFTGSAAVGAAIQKTSIAFPGRLLALELGGKNAAIVLEDADVELAARHTAFGAFVTAGQRCSATSRVFVHRALEPHFSARVVALAKGLQIGAPLANPQPFLGPMITEQSRQRTSAALQRASQEGYEVVLAAEQPTGMPPGWYLRPSVYRSDGVLAVEGYTDTELFAPHLSIYPVDDLEEAVALTNTSRFGLVTAVFTASTERFAAAASRLRSGLVHHNRSTAGASSRLPFGGLGASGNMRPAGVLAAQFCCFPQGVLTTPVKPSLPTWPGFDER